MTKLKKLYLYLQKTYGNKLGWVVLYREELPILKSHDTFIT